VHVRLGQSLPCGVIVNERSPLLIRFILHWRIRARGKLHRCWRHVLPCIMRDKWSSVSVWFILHWRVCSLKSMCDAYSGIILRTCERIRCWAPVSIGFILYRRICARDSVLDADSGILL
jgi:hypothetical protein